MTWKSNIGLYDAYCLKTYFRFMEQIHSKTDYYKRKYGLVPEFKAGANIGQVTATEVGDIKREIAYHGDVLNTASRIQSVCNDYKKHLLVSETLQKRIHSDSQFNRQFIGSVTLKGKEKPVNLYSVETN